MWRRWLIRGALAALIAPILLVLAIGMTGSPGTLLMLSEAIQGEPVRYRPVSLGLVSPHLVRAVIAAEDARFCQHWGFDVGAISQALGEEGRLRGASTISQQTAKNVFLWPDRSWLRKGIEAYFTALIELFWSKRRVMESYLNVAEFGGGAFGAEAAARRFFGVSASALTARQAAQLAAVLPSPQTWKANPPSPYVAQRAQILLRRMETVRAQGLDDCVLGR
ncbi:MAG: monofunctional biosynthetic peptidoglycan transglycosylase [Alphaproteobacteria bacterium]|nr:monofunctional biosynthetic peptidoglycan transglycosylase [Alphaproteobacteria bacterium]